MGFVPPLAGFLRNFENKFPDFQDLFQIFSGLFPDLTFPNGLPRLNSGTIIFTTIQVKLYQSWIKYYEKKCTVCQKMKSGKSFSFSTLTNQKFFFQTAWEPCVSNFPLYSRNSFCEVEYHYYNAHSTVSIRRNWSCETTKVVGTFFVTTKETSNFHWSPYWQVLGCFSHGPVAPRLESRHAVGNCVESDSRKLSWYAIESVPMESLRIFRLRFVKTSNVDLFWQKRQWL